ncbi:hypothetical protein LOTGIDRAFT_211070 [Lottia gigantea]|uniref:Zinc finger-containing ubiquitin peptidase 1 n=1 Tax=Lottia gigantea TaxID=225164 RepID=V3ZNQ9_LOTGI|nr:hypothetical protein LOTGIDRAFT_211070 [Lottia gigantea]ESO84115.1 hypothetical protein LOTGIDRAFT_211070 [Lottia gigantea]
MAEGGTICYNRPEKQYVCVLCGEEGIFESEMQEHIKMHTNENYCPFCDISGLKDGELTRHVDIEHLDLISPSSEKPSKPLHDEQIDYQKPSTSKSGYDSQIQNRPSTSYEYNSTSENLSKEEDMIKPEEKDKFNSLDSGYSSGFQNGSSDSESPLSKSVEGAAAISPAFSCPLCKYSTSSESSIQQHVNRDHSDILSPMKPVSGAVNSSKESKDVIYSCPICAMSLDSPKDIESHINSKHVDILSPGKLLATGSDELLICPVCCEVFTDPNFLASHVDGHFSTTHTPEQDQAEMEKKDFQTLQAMYGMDGKTDYKQQYEKNLERAVWNGHLSIPEYHKQKTNLKSNDLNGVDDGHSCTKGIIAKLQYYYKHTSSCVNKWYLATSVDHYSVSFGDKGWGCGYRNFQMLLSSLTAELNISQVLFNGKPQIPSIPKIQRLIEVAWEKGFDKQGCEQLGGRVVNTNKWIGATEIVATLSSLKIQCRLVDFLEPSGRDGTHPKLFQWVKEYFQSQLDFKAPLYLQHQGHSRTIIGIEEMKDGSDRLLIFDPSISQKQMQHFQGRIDNAMLRTLRRTLTGLKAKQYQIVAVLGVLSDSEYDRHKVLQSLRIR